MLYKGFEIIEIPYTFKVRLSKVIDVPFHKLDDARDFIDSLVKYNLKHKDTSAFYIYCEYRQPNVFWKHGWIKVSDLMLSGELPIIVEDTLQIEQVVCEQVYVMKKQKVYPFEAKLNCDGDGI